MIIIKKIWIITKKILKIAMLSLSVLLAFLIGLLIYIDNYQSTYLGKITNKENHAEVKFYEIGEPAFPFGSDNVKITYKNQRIKTGVNNDGVHANVSNFDVKWIGNNAVITVHGSDDEPNVSNKIILRNGKFYRN